MKLYTTEEIVREGYSICPDLTRDDYFEIEWVKKTDIIKKLDIILQKHRESGVMCSENCLCWEIDNLIQKLEEKEE